MKVIKLVVGEPLALALLLAQSDSASSVPDEGEEVATYEQRVATSLKIRLTQLQDDKENFARLSAAIKADSKHRSALQEVIDSQRVIELQVQDGIVSGLGNGSLDMTLAEARSGDYCLVPDLKLALALAFTNTQQAGRPPIDAMNAARALYSSFVSDSSGEKLKAAAAAVESVHKGWSTFDVMRLLSLMEALLTSQAIPNSEIGPMVGSGELVFRKV
jgi:hypothetical protein